MKKFILETLALILVLVFIGLLMLDERRTYSRRAKNRLTVTEEIIQRAAKEGFAFGNMAAGGWTNYNERTLSNSEHWTLTNNVSQ